MLNRDGITRTSLTNRNQILANVGLQASVGCVVPASMGVTVGTQKIAKAGTPITVDLSNRQTPAVAGDGTSAMNAVLLHDVDVTDGTASNGTALIFGFVNTKRLDTDVQTLVTTAVGNAAASKLVVFMDGDA